METYLKAMERRMQAFYRTLSEKERRRYAAIEADKLGHGEIDYISTIYLRLTRRPFGEGSMSSMTGTGYRRRGSEKKGGRKSKVEQHPELERVFLDVLREHTVGSPQDEGIR